MNIIINDMLQLQEIATTKSLLFSSSGIFRFNNFREFLRRFNVEITPISWVIYGGQDMDLWREAIFVYSWNFSGHLGHSCDVFETFSWKSNFSSKFLIFYKKLSYNNEVTIGDDFFSKRSKNRSTVQQ